LCDCTRDYNEHNDAVIASCYSLGASKQALLNKAFSHTSWNQLVFPKDLKHRGVDDKHKLPDYYYRDDGNLLWKSTEGFVTKILSDHYHNDDIIKHDTELQGFIAVSYKGVKKLRDFPSFFCNLNEIVEFITTIIWNGSILRSLLENSQYDYFGWIPNYPGTLLKPAPVKGQTTPADIFAALPSIKTSANQINVAVAVGKVNPQGFSFSKFYKEVYFREEKPLNHVHEWRDDLYDISQKISNDVTRKHKYTWLSPDKIRV